MTVSGYYSPEQLCADLEALVQLNPSIEDQRESWLLKASHIKSRLTSYLDLDRSVLSYAHTFVNDGAFMCRHSDYYDSERKKIIRCVAAYRANGGY
jgi:hypothetical protein